MAKTRTPRGFRREAKHLRPISLLSGRKTRIDPSQYRAHTNLKEFDGSTTGILRVWRHVPAEIPDDGRPADHFLVHGMRSENGKAVADVYDFAFGEEMIAGTLEAVAEHCGLEELRKQA